MSYQEEQLQAITDALRVRKKSKDKIKAIDIAQEILDLPIGYSVESILKDDGTQTLVISGEGGGSSVETGALAEYNATVFVDDNGNTVLALDSRLSEKNYVAGHLTKNGKTTLYLVNA